MIINILCPTRGRPQQFERMKKSALDMADDRSRVIVHGLAYTNDDSDYGPYVMRLHETCGRGAGPYWNILASFAEEHMRGKDGNHLYMLVGDDCLFETEGWDNLIKAQAKEFPDGIYCIAPNDNRTDKGAPHFVVSGKWIETLGYFVNPSFRHFCVDTYTAYLAKSIGRYFYMKDVLVTHKKAAIEHYDETADRIRRENGSKRDIEIMNLLINNGYADQEIESLRLAIP